MKRLIQWLIPVLLLMGLVFTAAWLLNRRPPATQAKKTPAAPAAKQLWTCSMHPQVIREQPGRCPICHMKLVPVNNPAADAHRKIKYWWDPMLGPSSIRDHPGKSAMGMDLTPVYEDEAPDDHPILSIDPAVVQNMGVQLAAIKRGPLEKTVRAAGFLTLPQPNRYDVNLRLSGWIERLSADTVGMRISKGQKLFELYSPQLTVAVRELIAAKKATDRRNPGDETSLADSAADALYQSARQKLRQWGLPDRQIDRLASMKTAPGSIPFYSPIDGILTETSVAAGSAVEAGQRIMRIVDDRTLWLDAQVHPQDLPWIHPHQMAEATFDALPGQARSGHVIFIAPVVHPKDRTTTVRLAIDNPDLKLRPGLYATVRLTATAAKEALLAPRSAVIDTGERQVVFVSLGQGHFQPRDVKTGLVGSDDNIQILSGLKAGDQVVVSGQFLLDADSRMREAVREFLQGGHGPAKPHDHDHSDPRSHTTTQPMHGAMPHDSTHH